MKERPCPLCGHRLSDHDTRDAGRCYHRARRGRFAETPAVGFDCDCILVNRCLNCHRAMTRKHTGRRHQVESWERYFQRKYCSDLCRRAQTHRCFHGSNDRCVFCQRIRELTTAAERVGPWSWVATWDRRTARRIG